ncbi:hypothetical protein [Nocardia sp. NPDC057668]|uniref:hypothetical protein n=1 Tax=Nocardia sp. NPDC057668 TaxID=3346202 RepID=UPI00366F9FB0
MFDLTAPEVSYMVGLFQTDGTHYGSTASKGRLSIELAARDAGVLTELQRHIPVHTLLGSRTRTTNFKSDSSTCFLHIYSRAARTEFERFGVPTGKKSDKIGPPPGEFSRSDYLRGILDGDGSIGFTAQGYPFISLITASSTLAQHFCAEIKAVCGVARSARPNKRDGVVNIMVANTSAVSLANWCYPVGAAPTIERKYTAARKVALWEPPHSGFGRSIKAWTPEQDVVALSHSIAEAAALLGRTTQSVNLRRWRLRRGARPSE